jgi:hypothetical protein
LSVKQERHEEAEEDTPVVEEVASGNDGDSDKNKDGEDEQEVDSEDGNTEEEVRREGKYHEHEERDGSHTPAGADGDPVEEEAPEGDDVSDLPGAMIERLLFGGEQLEPE